MNRSSSSILTYHSLDDSGSPISTPPSLFRLQMERLAERGIPVVALEEALDRPGSVALTFDDGYRGVLTHAAPVLERYGWPATVFVVSGRCGGYNDWDHPGRRRSPHPLMTPSELREIARAGLDLGAHGVSHRDLASLDNEAVDGELRGSRAALEDLLQRPIESCAYPYGRSTPAVREIARRHFRFACGTSLGFVSPSSDRFDLPRLDIYYLARSFWFGSVMDGDPFRYIPARGILRRIRAAL